MGRVDAGFARNSPYDVFATLFVFTQRAVWQKCIQVAGINKIAADFSEARVSKENGDEILFQKYGKFNKLKMKLNI